MRALMCLAVLLTACGSRSALNDSTPPAQVSDADPCAPPLVDACAESYASAPAGTELWSTSPDVGTASLIGPAAADERGTTFFLAAEGGLYLKKVFALDACGALRWQVDVSQWLPGSGYVPQVMVTGGHLLLVTVGALVALDPDTGELVWIADLDAFAEGGGLGVSPGKVQSLGYTAARKDGTVFSVVANDSDAWIVKVTPSGKPSPVAKVASYVGGFGYPLGKQQFVLDSAGHIVLAGGTQDRVEAFTAAGKSVFSAEVPSWGVGGYLASGPSYVTGWYLWLMSLDGTLMNDSVGGGPNFISWGNATVIDEAGELFSIGARNLSPGTSKQTFDLVGRFSATGDPKWSIIGSDSWIGGPILDDGDHVLLITGPSFEAGTTTKLSALNRADGLPAWQRELPPSGKVPSRWLLQNAAGALVTVVDDRVHAYASGGTQPPTCAWWPTPQGGLGQRRAPRGI